MDITIKSIEDAAMVAPTNKGALEKTRIEVSSEMDSGNTGQAQTNRFLGSLIFGIILVTAICLVASGAFIQESKSLVLVGISLIIADAVALILWRIQVPAFDWARPRLYLFGVGISTMVIYGLLRILLGP